jgi:hypothetical protein
VQEPDEELKWKIASFLAHKPSMEEASLTSYGSVRD